MKCPPAIATEAARQKALSEYGLDGSRALPSLGPVVQIAARAFGVPISLVNMIGSDHVFFAACAGLDDTAVNMTREVSFCAHAIAQDEVLVVPDATLDERFHDNPLVTGDFKLRFYAGAPLRSPAGHAIGVLCIIDHRVRNDFSNEDRERLQELARMASDRLELRRIEISSEQLARSFEDAARTSPTAIVRIDEHGRIVAWNHAAAALYGEDTAKVEGRTFETLVAVRDRARLRSLIADAARARSIEGCKMPDDLHGLRSDGTEFPLGLSLFCVRGIDRLLFHAHLQDLRSFIAEARTPEYLSSIDALTGLTNRASFFRRLEESLARVGEASVLMIDLDRLRDVNDMYGQQAGDSVLREVARRLSAAADVHDLIARVGGDEFAILLIGRGRAEHALSLARQAVTQVAKPIVIDGKEVCVAANCGIALAPTDAQEPLTLVANADLALYKAKKTGHGEVFSFVPSLRSEALERRQYGIELYRAVGEGQFALFFQPQVRLADGSLRGAEALIRWAHPQQGLLSPAAFLPALESGPLAVSVGSWVLETACAQAAQWRRHGMSGLRMGVNLFAAQLRAGDLAAEVEALLQRHGLPPDTLELEVTENIVLEQDHQVLDTLTRLRAMGVGIAFDDFGTGYASLSLLRTYPLSRIKIDRSFVQSMLESERDRTLVRAIVDMAHGCGLETIAEGVEHAPQAEWLCSIGCEEAQGYHFGKPMPAGMFAAAMNIEAGRRQTDQRVVG